MEDKRRIEYKKNEREKEGMNGEKESREAKQKEKYRRQKDIISKKTKEKEGNKK
jgi:hypothetical protein